MLYKYQGYISPAASAKSPTQIQESNPKILCYLKIISSRVCLIKAKKLFCTWFPNSAVPPRTLNKKKIIGASAKKYCIRSQILRYGLPGDFLSKWQKR